jgi:hypothetical protein
MTKKTVSFSLDEKSIEIIERRTREKQMLVDATGVDAKVSASNTVEGMIQDYDLFYNLIQQVKTDPEGGDNGRN